MEEEIIKYVEFLAKLTVPGVIGMVFVLIYKAGILHAVASYFKKSDSTIAKDFYAFKELAEGNHYTDLDSLLEWRKITEQWRSDTDKRLNQIAQDVAYLRGKIGNGHNNENS